jgi:hypothetical protein
LTHPKPSFYDYHFILIRFVRTAEVRGFWRSRQLRAARDAVEIANPAGGRAGRAEFLDDDIGRTAIYKFDCFYEGG